MSRYRTLIWRNGSSLVLRRPIRNPLPRPLFSFPSFAALSRNANKSLSASLLPSPASVSRRLQQQHQRHRTNQGLSSARQKGCHFITSLADRVFISNCSLMWSEISVFIFPNADILWHDKSVRIRISSTPRGTLHCGGIGFHIALP